MNGKQLKELYEKHQLHWLWVWCILAYSSNMHKHTHTHTQCLTFSLRPHANWSYLWMMAYRQAHNIEYKIMFFIFAFVRWFFFYIKTHKLDGVPFTPHFYRLSMNGLAFRSDAAPMRIYGLFRNKHIQTHAHALYTTYSVEYSMTIIVNAEAISIELLRLE